MVKKLSDEVKDRPEDIPFLVDVLVKNTKATDGAHINAAACIYDMSSNPQKFSELLENEVVQAMGILINNENGKYSDQVRQVAAHVLCLLSQQRQSNAVQKMVEILPTIHLVLCKVLLSETIDEATKSNTAGAMVNLATDEKFREKMCEKEVFDALFAAANMSGDSETVFKARTNASSSIWLVLKSPTNFSKAVNEFDVVNRLLDLFDKERPYQEVACYVLRHSCKVEDYAKVFMNEKNKDRLLKNYFGLLTKVTDEILSGNELPKPESNISLIRSISDGLYSLCRFDSLKLVFISGSNGEIFFPLISKLLSIPLLSTINSQLEKFNGDIEEIKKYLACALYEISKLKDSFEILSEQTIPKNNPKDLGVLGKSFENVLSNREPNHPFYNKDVESRQYICGYIYQLTNNCETFRQSFVENSKLMNLLIDNIFGNSDDLRLFVCASVGRICASNQNLSISLVKERGIFDKIMTVVSEATGNDAKKVRLATTALKALKQLLSVDENKRYLVEEKNIIDVALKMGSENARKEEKEWTVNLIYMFSDSNNQELRKMMIERKDVFELLVRVLETETGKTQEYASGAILNLGRDHEYRPTLAKNLAKLILKVFDKCESPSKSALIGAYCNVALHPEASTILYENGIFDWAIGVIMTHVSVKENQTIVERAASLLDCLSSDDSNAEDVVKNGNVEKLMEVLRQIKIQPGSTPLSEQYITSTIATLAFVEKNRAPMISTVLPLMDAFKTAATEKSRLHIAETFCFLANYPPHKIPLINIPNFLNLILEETKKESLHRERCATVLSDLCSCEENRLILVEKYHVLESLIPAVRTGSEKTKMYAVGGLLYLALEPENRLEMAESYDVLTVLTEIIKTPYVGNKNHNQTIYFACYCLQNLFESQDICQQVKDDHPNLINNLIQVMLYQQDKISKTARDALDTLELDDKAAFLSASAERRKGVPDTPDGVVMKMDDAERKLLDESKAQEKEKDKDTGGQEVDDMIKKENEKQAGYIMKEMGTSEDAYVNALNNLLIHFRDPLLKLKNAKALKVPEVFENIPQILETHGALRDSFKKIVVDGNRNLWPSQIAQLLTEQSNNLLRAVSPYVEKFDVMMELVNALSKDKKVIKAFEEAKKSTPLNIQSHLIMPIQRIPRLELMLRDLLKKTDKESKDYGLIDTAMAKIKQVANECNQKKKDADQKHALSNIQLCVTHFPDSSSFFSEKGKTFIYKGIVRLIAKSRFAVVVLYLFNDSILFALDPGSTDRNQNFHSVVRLDKKSKVSIATTEETSKLGVKFSQISTWRQEYTFAIRNPKETVFCVAKTQVDRDTLIQKISDHK
eukprot:c21507_g1_i2.p1 GENE.c21507_g1_i2~~c21507_g1_i2.p1  ORF type:complete len:1326 (+),score=606.27 c21507_g1_i2:30-4007(+)